MDKNEIKQIFKNIRKESQLFKLFEKYPELKKFCDDQMSLKFFNRYLDIVYFFKNDLSFKKCPICGKQLSFKSLKRGRTYCSNWCLTHSPKVKDAIKKTNFKKYGSNAPIGNPKIKQKIESTCLKKYGVKSPLSNKNVRQSIKETNIKKYGVDNVWKSKEIQHKIREICLEKYGSLKYVESNDFKEKFKSACLKKYDSNTPFSCKKIQYKVKNTIKEKYNVENIFQLKDLKQKQKVAKFRQSFKTIKSFKKYVIPLFIENEWKGYNHIYKWKCVKCGNEWYQKIYKTSFFPKISNYLPRCLNCYPFLNGFSNEEKELVEFCKYHFSSLKENDRSLIKPYELDIVIEELKLAIEFNGSYYHSNEFMPNYYHLNKVIKCNSLGYRLIHIWEDEWNSNKDLIKQKLINIFEGNEEIDYNQKLDRSWYNNLEGDFEELPPEIIKRHNFLVENCGYLIKKA